MLYNYSIFSWHAVDPAVPMVVTSPASFYFPTFRHFTGLSRALDLSSRGLGASAFDLVLSNASPVWTLNIAISSHSSFLQGI